MKNKLAMNTLRGFSVEDSIGFAVECGFDGIEIQTDYLEDASEIQKALDCGLNVSLHAPCGDINITSLNSGIRRESIAQVKEAIDMAARFNLRSVTFHPGRLSSAREVIDDKWNILLESVSEIAGYAKEKKVYVAMENMEGRKKEIVLSVDDLNKFCHIAEDNEYFGVTLDFSHFATNKIYPGDIDGIKVPVYNIHLSQCVECAPHYPVFEKGDIDMEEVIAVLKKYDYDSFVVIELKDVFDKETYIKSKNRLKEI